jgi:hypothetical protein
MKYKAGGTISLGEHIYDLESVEGEAEQLQFAGNGAFDDATFSEAELTELVEAGAAYEAPTTTATGS